MMITIARAPSESAAEEMTLALAAAGIMSRAREHDSWWEIEVPVHVADRAADVLRDVHVTAEEPSPVRLPQDRWPRAGLIAAALLVAAHTAAVWYGHDSVILRAGSSGYLLARGEVHRCVTALFVHADLQHLLSNACAIGVLMSGLAASVGSGAGMLLVLLAGAAGNALSGLARQSYRLSIGASTGVFAAVGILAARQCFERLRAPAERLKAWIPLGAGVALLSMLGAGPRTDLSAHFFGLLTGMALGGMHAMIAHARSRRLAQVVAGALAALVACAAWCAALAG